MAKTALKPAEISFHVSDDDQDLIHQIVNRADNLGLIRHRTYSKMTCSMDLTAVHANGNPLRLRDLLAADDFNFTHDICGIAACLNRDTAQFMKDFSPRFSQRRAS